MKKRMIMIFKQEPARKSLSLPALMLLAVTAVAVLAVCPTWADKVQTAESAATAETIAAEEGYTGAPVAVNFADVELLDVVYIFSRLTNLNVFIYQSPQ
jgi:flagellar basal body-associated protein FliL